MMRGVAMLAALLVAGCGDDGAGDGTSGTMSSSVGMTAELTSDGPTTDPSDGSSSSGMVADSSSSGAEPESSSSSGELPDVDYETDIQPIFNAHCTCHLQGASGMMTAPFMTLNPGVSYGEIVGVPAMQSDLDRVAPGDLDASYLWHKLRDTQLDVGGSGTSMPPTAALPQSDLILVRAWILQGAMP